MTNRDFYETALIQMAQTYRKAHPLLPVEEIAAKASTMALALLKRRYLIYKDHPPDSRPKDELARLLHDEYIQD